MAPTTRERILAASLTLFNEHGFDGVTTARIAENVGISEGNLWYHFRTKKDLVRAHQQLLTQKIARRLGLSWTPDTVLTSYIAFNRLMFEEMWEFQYLYRDSAEYGRTSPEMEERVRGIYKETTDRLKRFFDQMCDGGHLTMPRSELPALADNVWMVVRYWPSFLRETQEVVRMDKEALLAGIRHHLALFETHLSDEARAYIEKNAFTD
ncbi:TetR family transcriptional regulator [Tepidicaulis marinus]|jgi:AcrR family transcriptional regulator|uniref:TetR family transcriptional regulator n=1 Tax=Tepidicaulis marinus TaxID=1333998 RepID=A0A081B6L1_9HYPH|nr:TetR/AcrR family transcriptional regulator [Tepidicaulis marinus]GAK43679.1 TetR family transcriptional regulator [Tepidicaulis marinus]